MVQALEMQGSLIKFDIPNSAIMTKNYRFIFLLFAILFVSLGYSQEVRLQNVSTDSRTGMPRYAEVDGGSGLTEANFFDWFLKNYHFNSQVRFEILRSDNDEIGFTHSRYRQFFGDVEVLHSMLILHSKNGFIESFNGEYFNQFDQAQRLVTAAEARNTALASYGSKAVGKWLDKNAENELKEHKNDPEATWFPTEVDDYYAYPENYTGSSPLNRCYSVEIALISPVVHEQVLIDAITGKILRTIPLQVHTDSAGRAVTHYEGIKDITSDFVTTNSFRLRESGKRQVATYRGSIGTDYTDADNYWNNGTDKIAGDIHYGAELVVDFMKKYFNKNSYDGRGGTLVSVTSGGSGNAFWNLANNYATFLVGSTSSVGPCAALDVVGHEFGHGIADEISGLLYSGEACAIHESFADITGHMTEIMNDSLKANWWLGEKVWVSSNGIRYMKNPNQFNDPKAYGGQYYPKGCHGSGGVQNYWFYLQVAGDTGKNQFNYNFSLPGLGHWKACQILYRSMFYYMIPAAKFSDQYIGTLKAAKDLYGSCSYELEHTYKAWKTVNVEDTSVKTVDLSHGIKAPTLLCNGAPVTATLSSFGDISRTVFWKINKVDTTSKKTFSYTFNKTGSYQVILTTVTCGKTFMDSMYITVNYTPQPNFLKPFDSACESSTKAKFTNTTVNADKNIPLKYYWLVNPGAIIDSTTDLYVKFPLPIDYEISMKAYYEGGCWAVTKKYVTILERPKPDFSVLRDACEEREIRVRNLTDKFKKNLSFEWTFPDLSVYKGFEPVNKSHSVAGNFDIVLKGTMPYGNCSDTAMRKVKILPNPKPDFTWKNNCKNLDMTVFSGGKLFAPKQWSQWHLGTYNPINKDTFTFNALDSSARTIGLTIGDSTGCFYTIYKTIILENLNGKLQAGTVCYGDSTQLNLVTQHSGSLKLNWDMGNGKKPTGQQKYYLYSTAGLFDIVLNLSTEYCSKVLMAKALVKSSPSTDFTVKDVCDGDTVHFQNLTAGKDTTQFLWNFGDNMTSADLQPGYLYQSGVTRTFNVNLHGTYSNGCAHSVTRQVTVFELPKCGFKSEYDLNAGNNGFNFTPDILGYTSYSWDFGDGEFSTEQKPFHRFKANGKYNVKLIAKNSAGCECELITEVTASYSGINSTQAASFRVYPNPTSGLLNIEGFGGITDYKLYDFKGRLMKFGNFNSPLHSISVSDFSSGIYLLELQTGNYRNSVKLIIE